jgi:putative copper resistance protein D
VTSLDGVLAACRLVHYAALVLVFGSAVFLCLLAPPAVAMALGRSLRLPVRLGLLLVVATTWLWLPLEAAEIADSWNGATDPDTLSAVLSGTDFGQVWLDRAFLAAVLLSLAAGWPRRPGATGLAAGLLLASLSLISHAAMQGGPMGWLHRLNHAVHVLCGGFWIGALVPFILSLRLLRDLDLRPEAAQALRRFSSAGHVAVAAVLASGVVNIDLVLGRWPTDWSSPYQALLAAKIGAVLAMVALAVANRYLLVPRIGRSNGRAILAIRSGAVAEILLGTTVLALVAVFGLFDPA